MPGYSVARKRLFTSEADEGKQLLERIDAGSGDREDNLDRAINGRIDAMAHDRKPAIAAGPWHEKESERDDDCEPEPEDESCLGEV